LFRTVERKREKMVTVQTLLREEGGKGKGLQSYLSQSKNSKDRYKIKKRIEMVD